MKRHNNHQFSFNLAVKRTGNPVISADIANSVKLRQEHVSPEHSSLYHTFDLTEVICSRVNSLGVDSKFISVTTKPEQNHKPFIKIKSLQKHLVQPQ